MNKIRIVDWTATDENILSGSAIIEDALAAEELRLDTLHATLDGSEVRPTLFQPADADGLLTKKDELFGVQPWFRMLVQDFSVYGYGDPVWYYHEGKLIGKFFMESIERVGPTAFEISCTSSVGLLVNSQHYGGIYTGQKAVDVLKDIIGGAVDYTLDQRLLDIPIYGWLPVASRRDNLHQFIFALGAIASKDVAGALRITVLEEKDPSKMSEERIKLGGNVDYQTPATQVLVSEHAYTAYDTDSEVVLFEGEVAAEPLITPNGQQVTGALVLYDGPMHDVTVSNGSILEQGVNYAVLGQSSDCRLAGKAYTHTVRVIQGKRKEETAALSEMKDNVVTVENATLVSLANSENVASRLAAYYGSVKTIENEIVVGDERPGDTVSFLDPFGEETVGFLSGMDLTMSKTLTASATILSGYAPGDYGNYYSHSVVITSEQNWTVPPEAKRKIRAVLIGGGYGGDTGESGTDGTRPRGYTIGDGGEPGKGGKGGKGGKVFVITLSVTSGQSFHAIIGTGGSPGQAGTASKFGTYTSDDGLSSTSGYTDLFTGKKYAMPGEDGLDGGAGAGSNGEGTNIIYKGVTYRPGAIGASLSEDGFKGIGGRGGGPAAGRNGNNGGDADYDSNQGNGFMDGGSGGNGATGVAGEDASTLGSGGEGGHGGGGGGGGGGASGNSQLIWEGDGGKGGAGSPGGRGGDGLIIVYW